LWIASRQPIGRKKEEETAFSPAEFRRDHISLVPIVADDRSFTAR
jgi:hypothetical protein